MESQQDQSPSKSRTNSTVDLHIHQPPTTVESFEKIKLIGKGDVGKVGEVSKIISDTLKGVFGSAQRKQENICNESIG
jgi:hypothetical protein